MEHKLLIMTGDLPSYHLKMYQDTVGEGLHVYTLFPMEFESTIIGIKEVYNDPSAEHTYDTINDALTDLAIDEMFFQYGELPFNTESKLLYLCANQLTDVYPKGYFVPDQREVIIFANDGFKFADPEKGLPTHPVAIMEVVELEVTYEQLHTLVSVKDVTGVQLDVMAHIARGEVSLVQPVLETAVLNNLAQDTTIEGITFYQIVKTLNPHEIVAYYESHGVTPKAITQ